MTAINPPILRRTTVSDTNHRNTAPSANPGSTLGNNRRNSPQSAPRRYRATATTSPVSNNSSTAAVDSLAGMTDANTATAIAANPPTDVLEIPINKAA